MITIKKGSKYILIFEVSGHLLTYTAVILDINSDFISFKDKFGEEKTFNLKNLVEYRENGKEQRAKDGED